MKKFLKATLIAILFVITAIGIAGCDSVSRIRVKTENMPRTVYVQGQDLDLSEGKLTVTRKEGSEDIPLDSADIAISGYDKNKLGKQELTVEYAKQTTTFEVEVVARVVVQNYEPSYFVGEEFNREKGRLVITRDDGTSFNVALNDASVSIEGFDSVAAASPLTVTARYTGNNMNYTGTFDVNIYAIGEVQFTRPNKSEYFSHETQLDLAGGYITYRGNNGALTRYINLTENMVSGFDPKKATVANRTQPLEQTITVNYGGQSFTFEVTIKYSDVSYFIEKSAELSKIEWTAQTAPTKEQGELALELTELYLGMDFDDASLIPGDGVSAAARVASVYAFNRWKELLGEYSDTLIPQDGSLYLNAGGSYEDAKKAYEGLQNKEGEVWKLGSRLKDLIFYFGSEVLYSGEEADVTVTDYTADFCENSKIESQLSALKYLTEAHEALTGVPATWTIDDLKNSYAETIEKAYAAVTGSSLANVGNRSLYTVLSGWREKDDYFDILYSYYFYKDESITEDSAVKIFSLQDLHLPHPLEELYTSVREAMTYLAYAAQMLVIGSDSTPFMLTYREIEQQIVAISEAQDTMIITLYNSLRFSGLLSQGGTPIAVSFSQLISYLNTASYGYLQVNGGWLDDIEFTELWEKYLSIVEHLLSEDGESYEGSEQFRTDAHELAEGFAKMAPSKQYGFLCSVNNFYTQGYPQIAFQTASSYFVLILADYATTALPENAQDLFLNLMLAIELYSRQCNTSGAIELFKQQMTAILSAYNSLGKSDQKAFDDCFGAVLDQYLKIANLYDENGALKEEPDLESDSLAEYKAPIEGLIEAVRLGNNMYAQITQTENGLLYLPAFLAACERAEALAAQIVASDVDAVKEVYYYKPFAIFSNASLTLEYALYYLRTLKVNLLTNSQLSAAFGFNYLIWDLYEGPYADVQNLMSALYPAVYAYLTRGTDDEGNPLPPTYQAKDIESLLDNYLELSAEDRMFYLNLDPGGFFSVILTSYYEQVLTEDGQKALIDLLNLERALMLYELDPEGSFKQEDGSTTTYAQLLEERHKSAEESYNALTNEKDTEELEDLHDLLMEKYEKRDELGKTDPDPTDPDPTDPDPSEN